MTTTTEPEPPAAGHPWDGAIFDGTFRGAAGSITVTAPATGQVIGRVGQAAPSDLDRGVELARTAQRGWAAQPYIARVAVMLRAAQLLEADPGRLTRWLVEEAGSGQGKAAGCDHRHRQRAWSYHWSDEASAEESHAVPLERVPCRRSRGGAV